MICGGGDIIWKPEKSSTVGRAAKQFICFCIIKIVWDKGKFVSNIDALFASKKMMLRITKKRTKFSINYQFLLFWIIKNL
jgi:hypothetical protein